MVEYLKSQEGFVLKYLEWNNAIASHFFNGDKSGQRIWLSVEKDLIEKIAQENKTTLKEFIEVVKLGPDEIKNDLKQNNICKKAYKIYTKWRENKDQFEYPPYIAYLALFTLAINHGDRDDFSGNNYYGRLNDLLKDEKEISTPQFKRIVNLWKDLEKWSLKDKKGNLGEFHFDIYGQRIYVGIPLYQVVLPKIDQKKLPELFWKMGWDSNSNPTDKELLQAIEENKNIFSRKTSKRIEKNSPEVLQRLIDRVLAELKEYDENQTNATNQISEDKRGFIDLCLNIDRTAGKISISFRCRRIAGLPDEAFTLKSKDKEWQVPPLLSSISGPIRDFFLINWEKDFPAHSGKYQFHYRGQKYKIFTQADKLGLSGMISGQRYTPHKLFYLAVHSSLSNKVQKWGDSECDKCKELSFSGDLPKDWHLFEIEGVKGDSLIKNDIPSLAMDKKLRVLFKNGIRCSRGNKFFDFAPPEVLIMGKKDQTQNLFYKINDQKNKLIPIDREPDLFQLPKDIPFGEDIKIVVNESNHSIMTISKFGEDITIVVNEESKEIGRLMFVKSQLKKFFDYEERLQIDCFGNFKEQNGQKEPCLQGTYGPYLERTTNNYNKLPSPLSNSKKDAYFIGDMNGEIMRWQKDPWPKSWTPFWVLQFRTKKEAEVHCYIKEDHMTPLQPIAIKDFRERKHYWKDIVENKKNKFKLLCGHEQCEKKWEQFKKKHRSNFKSKTQNFAK